MSTLVIESTSLLADRPRHDESDRDKAKERDRLPLRQLERFLEDLKWEPSWRVEADKCCEYYDNNQLDSDTIFALQQRGLGPIIRNIIKPTIDTILGLEERTKTDWKVTTDYEDQTPVADALSVKLAEAEKAAQADRAISEAYAEMVKAGFSCVEVSRRSNPFDYPYRVEHVHRREIRWDPKSRKKDWTDARFILRKRWYDKDVAMAHFPKHAELIEYSVDKWSGWEAMAALHDEGQSLDLAQAYDLERATRIEETTWRDSERGQVCLYEVWYRMWYRGMVLKLPRGRVVEFDPKNVQHVAIVRAGITQPQEAVYDKLRCAFYCGPHRLADFPTNRRRFPYVPFWAFREDTTGVPYGQIRSMISTQDEINARAANMYWLLKARRLLIDSDALDTKHNTLTQVETEFGRADAMIVLNPMRKRDKAIEIMENLQLAESQRIALGEAINAMSQVSGIYQTMMGQSKGGATAARAIEALLDAGTTSLAEMNGNYAWARREVGDRLLELVREDLTQETKVAVDTGTATRSVHINRKIIDPDTGQPVIENSVQNALVKVTLADIPSSPSHRDAQFAQLTEVVKSLPPEIQAILTPFIIESSNQPKRREMAKLLRQRLGIIDEESEEGKAAKAQADQAAKMQADQLAKQFDAELEEVKARADKLRAEAEKIRAEGGDDGEVMQLRADYEQKITQLMREKAMLEVDRQIETQKIEMEAEDRAMQHEGKMDLEREKIASQERMAQANQVADEKIAAVKEQMDALSQEIDDRLDEILSNLQTEKTVDGAKRQAEEAKKDAARKVEAERLKQTVEKKVGGLEKKLAVNAAKASAKPKPAAKK